MTPGITGRLDVGLQKQCHWYSDVELLEKYLGQDRHTFCMEQWVIDIVVMPYCSSKERSFGDEGQR
jgi:hypothetical protein